MESAATVWTAAGDRSAPPSHGAALRQTLASMANKSLFFGAIGGAFAAGRCNAVVFRETEDWYNDVAGSLAAGAIVGIKSTYARSDAPGIPT